MAKLGVELCDLDLWPWPFAWTSLLTMVITPESFMMIPWWEHDEKGVTDVQTDRQTDRLNQSNSCLVAAKNNRAPLLCYFKPCKSFHSHWTIQARVSFRKRQIRVKISDFFCPVWPWNLTDDLLKQLGTSSMLLQAWSVISWPSVNSN